MNVSKNFQTENKMLVRYVGDETEVTVPDSIQFIAAWAFKNCVRVEKITLHSEIIHISPQAFEGCVSLKTVSVSEDNREYRTVNGDLYTKNGEELVYYAAGKGDEGFTVPKGVKTVGEGAFLSAPNLKRIIIPEGVSIIGRLAFADCRKLESVVIPNSVTSIDVGTFALCTALKTAILPEGSTSIGMNAFHGCLGIEELSIPESVSKIGVKAFNGIPKTATLHLKWDFLPLLEDKELVDEWGCAIRGFLKRYYLSGLRASDGNNWTKYIKSHTAKALRVLPNEPLLYRFLAENKMLLTRTVSDLLAKTENTECRAILLDYLNTRRKKSIEDTVDDKFTIN